MTFSTIELANDRVLVQGTDFAGTVGKQVLDATEWNGIKREQQLAGLTDQFDAAVEEFFAPLTDAADKLQAAFQVETDPLFYIVTDEGTAGQAPVARTVAHLSQDSVILRLLEQDAATTRLVWVGDKLEIIAALKAAPVVEAAEPLEF